MKSFFLLLVAAFWLSVASMYIYGIIAAFKVVWWIGLICLVFGPCALIEGLIKFFGGPDLALKLFQAFGN